MTVALTGATGFLGLRLLEELLRDHDHIIVLAHAGSAPAPERIACYFADTAPIPDLAQRITTVEVDLAEPRLGLTPPRFRELAAEIDTLWHSAGNVNLEADLPAVRAVNVAGTRHILELAAAGERPPKVRHISTAMVAGAHPPGPVAEGALDGSHGFHNAYEQSKYETELLVRRWSRTHRTSVVVFRPSVLVTDRPAQPGLPGHTLTVAMDIMAGIAQRATAAGARAENDRTMLRVVGHPEARFNIVPVECAARAMVRLAAPHSEPGLDTYHIVHPDGVPVTTFFAAVERLFPLRYALVPETPADPTPLESVLASYSGFARYASCRLSFDDSRARAELGAEIVDTVVDLDYLTAAMRPVTV